MKKRFGEVVKAHGLTLGAAVDAGGQAQIFRATDEAGTQLAIKRLTNLGRRSRFDREVATMRRLIEEGCTAIPPVLGSSSTEDLAFYWMPFYESGSLQTRLDGNEVEDRLALCAELVSAVDEIHSRGVAHRDLKPANILFDESDVALLADFGLCLPGDADRHTEVNEQAGPRFYIAPELRDGRQDKADHRSADLYSLAKIMWCVLARRSLPFDRERPHWEPQNIPSIVTSDPSLLPLEERLRQWMSEDPNRRLTVRPAEVLDAITVAGIPEAKGDATRVGADPSVVNRIKQRDGDRRRRVAQEEAAIRESDENLLQDRLRRLELWMNAGLATSVRDFVQISTEWSTYAEYGAVAPETVMLSSVSLLHIPLRAAIGGAHARAPQTTSVTLDGNGPPFRIDRDLWGFKIEIDGEDPILIGLTCELGAEEIGLYAGAFRQRPTEGPQIDPQLFAPILEYHPPLHESTCRRAAQLALKVTASVVSYVELAIGADPPRSHNS